MHPVLEDMIVRFRAAQDIGVAFVDRVLADVLGVRRPTSGPDWVTLCQESGLYHIRKVNGVVVYAHGYGIELTDPELSIDFDWGDAGEPDGFDAWRLWWFFESNLLPTACESLGQVRGWLHEAAAAGELTRDRRLYYSPKQRAARTHSSRPAAPASP